jgi:hypothetical protein
MIGREDDKDEVTFKVADRRKFNPDGSIREGVVLDKAAAVITEVAERAEAAVGLSDSAVNKEPSDRIAAERAHDLEQLDEEDDIPGADDPASFVNFLSTLATNAAAALGAVPHPATGKRSLDLDTGKYWLDVLGMIKEKTKGNLHEQEARLLDSLLADLRMQYVTMVRATEEKLKANAAKKFSSADILGKK